MPMTPVEHMEYAVHISAATGLDIDEALNYCEADYAMFVVGGLYALKRVVDAIHGCTLEQIQPAIEDVFTDLPKPPAASWEGADDGGE